MTTIAFRDGVLAADTLISYSTYTNGNRSKIVRCGDYQVGLAGLAWIKEPFEKWVSDGCDPELVPQAVLDNESAFAVLLMDDSGKAYDYAKGYLVPIDAEYHAIGSGGFFAMGAMAHGASAIEAVLAGIRHDKASGGGITHVEAPIQYAVMTAVTGRASHQLPN